MKKIVEFIKPVLIAGAVIVVLKLTGTMSSVSYYANSALMKTGLLDAQPEDEFTGGETLDYNFKLKSVTGEVVDFSEFKGKVVFINLWATWCGPCRTEMPSIQGLYDGVDQSKIQFVMLSLDRDDALPKVVQYVGKNKYTFPVYQPTGSLPKQLQVPSIPTTFIIDKNGNIVSKKVGATNFNTDKFKKYLEDLAK